MKAHLSVKNVVIAVLAAAVVGLGTVVALDRVQAGAPQVQAVTAAATEPGGAAFTGVAANTRGFDMAMVNRFAQELGVTAAQLKADVMAGQTLDEIAGSKDAQVKSDLLTYARNALDKAVTRGAISSSQESSLLSDAQDAINQLFAAHLGKLLPLP